MGEHSRDVGPSPIAPGRGIVQPVGRAQGANVVGMFFTMEELARLARIRVPTLRRWVLTDVFHPERGTERAPIPPFFTFRDVVGLRVLRELRERRVVLQHLRDAGAWLYQFSDAPWSKLRVGIANRRVQFTNPKTGKFEEVFSGQTGIKEAVALDAIAKDLTKTVTRARTRPAAAAGKVTRNRGVAGGLECFEGTRIPVSMIVSMLESGASDAEVLREYPTLKRADVLRARRATKKKRAA